MRGISAIIAVVIIVAVAVAISVGLAMWLIGVSSSAGYGTRPVRLDIYSFQKFGPMYRLILRNTGSESLLIDDILINDKPSTIKLVYDLEDPDKYFKLYVKGVTVRDDPIRVDPGQTVSVIGIPPVELRSGQVYSIRVHTALGFEAYVPLEISSAIPVEMYMVRLVALTDAPHARLFVSVDGGAEAWLNNYKVLSRISDSVTASYWNYNVLVDDKLRDDYNILAIHARRNNAQYSYIDAEIGFQVKKWDPVAKTMVNAYYLSLRFDKKWRYTTQTPAQNWYEPGFNDTGWRIGETPIGNTRQPSTATCFTDLYARKTIRVPDQVNGVPVTGIAYAELRISSDDGAEAWVNGDKVLSRITDTHGSDYWNYRVDVTDAVSLGGNTLAIHIHNTGSTCYMDAELYVALVLSNGETAVLVYPPRFEARYIADTTPPQGWYMRSFNDTGWNKGTLPIGNHPSPRAPNTQLSYNDIYVRINFTFPDGAPVAFVNGWYRRLHTGYSGWMVEFNPVTWEYRYWRLYNPDGDPRTTDDMILVGANNTVGSLKNPPPPQYSGETIVVQSYGDHAHDFVVNTPGGYGISSPFIVVLNPHVKKASNYTWYNLNEAVKQKFVRQPVDRAIQGLDLIILWEDLWHGPPPTTTWTWNDAYSLIDHVVRVTWREDGSVRIAVYRCSGWYLHVFLLGTQYIYYKPHSDNWGETTGGDPNPQGIWWYTDSQGFYVEYERGLPRAGYEYWISPSGYKVEIWEIK